MGFSVLKQEPYKGDAHTENAMRVAMFLTHPVHLARSQLRFFRHLPPNPQRFGEIFPELVNADDKWVKFYNAAADSDIAVAGSPPTVGDPKQAAELRAKVDQWLAAEGMNILEEVIYKKVTPKEGAERFFSELKRLTA